MNNLHGKIICIGQDTFFASCFAQMLSPRPWILKCLHMNLKNYQFLREIRLEKITEILEKLEKDLLYLNKEIKSNKDKCKI